MFLKHKASGDMVEVLNTVALINPCEGQVSGRFHSGEEMPEPTDFAKSDLEFPSGEALPRCWVDSHYKD